MTAIWQTTALARQPAQDSVSGRWVYRVVVVILLMAEIVSALSLAWINPVQGYDENWYLINAHRFRGTTTLPYACYRPPLLPMVLALLGDYYRLSSGLAHVGATVLTFLMVRRLTSPLLAVGVAVVFMASGDLRWFNMLMLTEMPSIFLLLLAVYLYVLDRPFLVGIVAALAVMVHWSMATVLPVLAAVYLLKGNWRAGGWFLGSVALAFVPLLVGYTVAHGSPLGPILTSMSVQHTGHNDLWYYVREFPQLPVALMAGGLFALVWTFIRWRCWKTEPQYDLCILLLGVLAIRLVLLHLIDVKGARFLVPLIPVLLLLSVLMLWHYARTKPIVQCCVCGMLLVSVMPGKTLYWSVHSLARDPVRAIIQFKPLIAAVDPAETIYTDLNDLAVMAQTGRPAVAVTGPASWHHPLTNRPSVSRREVPDGALYLTWDPGRSAVLAVSDPTPRGPLNLVRWRADPSTNRNTMRPSTPGTGRRPMPGWD